MDRLTIEALQTDIGVTADGIFGPRSVAALSKRLSNPTAPALTAADFQAAADRLDVPVGHIKGVRKVEAPRGPYDDLGRPSALYERHKFRIFTVPPGRFSSSNPDLSGPAYGAGGYGPYSAQYQKFFAACKLDPYAAFKACSWGAFQVLGEHAEVLGYASAYDMVKSLVVSEAAHLETFVRYVERFELTDELRACRPNNPDSCRAFVKAYNGQTYEQFAYHLKFAKAIDC